MKFSPSSLFLALVALHGASASPLSKRTYNIDASTCDLTTYPDAEALIRAGLQNVLRVLSTVTAAEFTADDPNYRTFFGASETALEPAQFNDIKLRFQNARRILQGESTAITFKCPKNNGKWGCNPDTVAYVTPSTEPNVVNFCPLYFDQPPAPTVPPVRNTKITFKEMFGADGALDCAARSGHNAWEKTKEQVLIHEMMHLPGITALGFTEQVPDPKDQIIDCMYGTYASGNFRQHANGYEVARINADSYSFTAIFSYLSQQCHNNPPVIATQMDAYPTIWEKKDPRCYLGDKTNAASPQIDVMNSDVNIFRTLYQIPNPLVRGHKTVIQVPVKYACPPGGWLQVASQQKGMKGCLYE